MKGPPDRFAEAAELRAKAASYREAIGLFGPFSDGLFRTMARLNEEQADRLSGPTVGELPPEPRP